MAYPSESDVEFREVRIRVPADEVPDLLIALGSYALEHDTRIDSLTIGDSSEQLPANPTPQFNPDLVSSIFITNASGEEERVPVILEPAITQLCQQRTFPQRIAKRTFTALMHPVRPDEVQDIHHYLINDSGKLRGLRADRLPELIERLRPTEARPTNFGVSCFKLLELLLDNLYIPEETPS